MSAYDDVSRDRAERESTSGAIPCVVTAVDLSAEPTVTVRPLAAIPFDTFDGVTLVQQPLEINEVPYVFPRSASFAVFIPPEIGMQGFLTVSQIEIGDVPSGVASSSRRKDGRSGYFTPGGNLTGSTFTGSPDWAEMRSGQSRIALSGDTVHLETGGNSIVVSMSGFDVMVNGISLIDALKQLSAHVRALELLVHPNGNVHTGPQTRTIDTFVKATPPVRNERGIR